MKNKLDIFLITYNRKSHLQNTFNQIFADDSPIKNFDITILDNKSDDGTSDLIKEYQERFPNIKHIIHNRNIGGNGNIARGFEMASKEYFWILCDDDVFDFTYWNEVENEIINGDNDAIVISNYLDPNRNFAQLVKQMTFVPSTIYKTRNIDDTTMVNIEFLISTMFPQLGAVLQLINENKKIKVMNHWVVKMVLNGGAESYTRGLSNLKHPYMRDMFWEVGFINAIQGIKDKSKRDFIINKINLNDKNLRGAYSSIFKTNTKYFNSSFKNLFDVYAGLSFSQKILYIISLFLDKFLKKIVSNIFSFRNSFNDEGVKFKVITILGIKIKIKLKNKKDFEKNL